MAEPVRIEVADSAEAVDLVRALAVRGLAGGVVEGQGGPAVELAYTREETERLLAELLPALEEWSDDRRRGPLTIRVGVRSRRVGERARAA